MKAEGVIFDMDGLMFDTERLGLHGWKKAGRNLGYPIGEEMVARIRGCNSADVRRLFIAEYGEQFDFDQALKIRLDYAEQMIRRYGVPVKPGLYHLLEFLRGKGYPMAVATASDKGRALSYLKSTGTLEYFDAIVCGDEAEHAKPWPDIFMMAAERLNISCAGAVVLEDSINGIEAAFRAGCIPVMIPDLTKPDEAVRKKAFCVLKGLDEVEPLLFF